MGQERPGLAWCRPGWRSALWSVPAGRGGRTAAAAALLTATNTGLVLKLRCPPTRVYSSRVLYLCRQPLQFPVRKQNNGNLESHWEKR